MSRLDDADLRRIAAAVRRAAGHAVVPMPAEQVDAAVGLAVALYAAALEHGLEPADADGVTSFVHAAIDGVRTVERRRSQRRWTT